jgi:hypothetical protein
MLPHMLSCTGTDAGGERMVTNDKHRGIRIFTWSEDSRYILFLQVSPLCLLSTYSGLAY